MSIFSKVESGTSFHSSRFTKSISNRMDYDCQFHQAVPVLKRFCLPGDVWRIGGDVLVRFQPMRTPTLTPNNFRVRYFFVPLRLVEPNTELIITGSNNGHLYNDTLPVFDNFVTNAATDDDYVVAKHSFWDYMNVQCLDYKAIKDDECLPAKYWHKGYLRIRYDYYDDENIGTLHQNFNDFESVLNYYEDFGAAVSCFYTPLSKDYFTSALPWQLKAVAAPTITVTGTGTMQPAYSNPWFDIEGESSPFHGYADASPLQNLIVATNPHNDTKPFTIANTGSNVSVGAGSPGSVKQNITGTDSINEVNDRILDLLNQEQDVDITALGFNASDLRTMMAQTRIFERLARTGSRYTEYLRANFGRSPADDTLQRAQYLGGWKVPIITTEVLQTAGAGDTPVGTMRGHGITRGSQRINTFYCKEFGMLFGIAEVRPDIQYTTGIPRQLTYKRRFDFFNPSLQHLSEQEVRNGELFISNTDGKNDVTFGFQAYANELRTCQNETCGDLRASLSDWNQALHFNSRPNLNNAFISGESHRASFNEPFVVQSADAYPIIVQFYNRLDVYRPMVRYATPGLVDHL